MRRSGKTTRTIDSAIQAFFSNEESLYVPTYHQLKDREENTNVAQPIPEDVSDSQLVIDPDWNLGTNVQRHLLGAIAQRLNFEHMGQARNYRIRGQYILKLVEDSEEAR